jgi:two-component system phosphate regulon sensor histidine kinase PhoR
MQDGVAFEVSDNGGGIPHGEHRRIFDKFYRIDDRLSRTREGSGLGLAIVKHIVRAHHGRILLESGTDSGSTFRIVLPPFVARASSGSTRPSRAKGA